MYNIYARNKQLITSLLFLRMGFDPPISAKLHSQFISTCTVYSIFKLLFMVELKAVF